MQFGTSTVTSKFENLIFLLNEYFCKFAIFSGLLIDLDGNVVRVQLYLCNRLAKSSIKSHLKRKNYGKKNALKSDLGNNRHPTLRSAYWYGTQSCVWCVSGFPPGGVPGPGELSSYYAHLIEHEVLRPNSLEMSECHVEESHN